MSVQFPWKDLFGLPPAVASLVLTEWLAIQHIGLLDSACCNKTVRETFLDVCQQKQISFSAKDVCPANRLFVWVIVRMFHLRDCYCSNETDLALFASLLTMTGNTLRRLHVHGSSELQLLSAAEIIAITSQVAFKCANVSVIQFENCIIPCVSDIINKNCSLVEIHFQSCKMFGFSPVEYNSTRQLHTVALHECEFTQSSANYFGRLAERAQKFGMSAEGSCPHLTSLVGKLANLKELFLFNLDIRDDDLIAVVARCSLITRLYIPKCKSVIFAVQHLQLQVIDVGTINLTNEFLHAVGEHCFALETLLFERTDTFTVDAIAAVV